MNAKLLSHISNNALILINGKLDKFINIYEIRVDNHEMKRIGAVYTEKDFYFSELN